MKSAAFYFNVSAPLIRENLRRYWAIPTISFLVYFLSGVFPILISYSHLNDMYYFIDTLLDNQYPMFMMAHLIAPVVTGVVIFRYIQTSAAVTSLHAMPFTRAALLNSNILSGLIMITAPVFLTGLFLLLISKPVHNPYVVNRPGQVPLPEDLVDVFARADIINWMWISFIIILVIYAVTVFAGFVTGNSIMHIFAAFGFNFLVPALFGVFTVYCEQFLYGFNTGRALGHAALSLSPYLKVFDDYGPFPWIPQILYILNALALFAVSMLLYYRRKLERASDSFVFGFMIPVISYLIAFFGMTMLGFYFNAIGNSGAYFYAGLLSGAVIFFLIGRMVVKKTFRVFNKRTVQSLGLYLLLAALFVTSFAFDLTGFEKRVPAENSINGAIISGIMPNSGFSGYGAAFTLSTEKNISALRELHGSILENSPKAANRNDYRYTNSKYGEIRYDLKGIFNMSRAYSVNYGLLKDSRALAEIFESDEYKSQCVLSNADFTGLSSVEIRNPVFYSWNNTVLITGRDKINALLECYDADLKAQKYEDAIGFGGAFAMLSFNAQPYANVGWNEVAIPRSYKKTVSWLRDNGYAERIEITPDMVSGIKIQKYGAGYYGDAYYNDKYNEYSAPPPVDAKVLSSESIVITEKDQIALILDTFENSVYTREYYEGVIVFEPEIIEKFGEYYDRIIFFSDEAVPAFVKGMF